MKPFVHLSDDEVADYYRMLWTERIARRLQIQLVGGFALAHIARRKLAYLRALPQFERLPLSGKVIFSQLLASREAAEWDRALQAGVSARAPLTALRALRKQLGLGESAL